MKRILEGVRRFQEDIFPQERERFQSLADRQAPEALFITCADSRVLPNLITRATGDLLICRNAGNMVPPFGELAGACPPPSSTPSRHLVSGTSSSAAIPTVAR